MREDIVLTVAGVVYVPPGTFMHPEAFKWAFGQEEYDKAAARPRVITSYDDDFIQETP